MNFINNFSGRFDGLFDSKLEMGFYVFCMIALHMIVAHMFYGPPSRRRIRSLNFQRSFIIFILVIEIVVFTNLLTFDHFSQILDNNPALNQPHVHNFN